MIDKEILKENLKNAQYNRGRNHLISDCPFCKKEGHYYTNVRKIFMKKGGRYATASDCKKCKESANLPKLLNQLDLSHLIDGEQVDLNKPLFNLGEFEKGELDEKEESIFLPEKKMPVGFKRMYKDKYLKSRGFTSFEFNKYSVGITNLKLSLDGFIIITVEEGGLPRAYMARSTKSKNEIKKINKKFKKQGSKKKYLRYANSTDDFSKLLLGIDEVDFFTKWVILVEGFFDKVRTDQVLGLDHEKHTKCCVTFGKSVSPLQVLKLKRRGIKNVILIQDPDAVKDTKMTADILNTEFDKVLVGFTGINDLGDSSAKEIDNVIDNLMTPQQFRREILELLPQ